MLAIHNKSLVENENKSALEKAIDIGINVKGHFDWDNHLDVMEKVLEEVSELKEAVHEKTKADAFDEMGDVLFTIAQLARHMSLSPEASLEFAMKKHKIRYDEMIKLIKNDNKNLLEMALHEIEPYWSSAKIKTSLKVQTVLNQSI